MCRILQINRSTYYYEAKQRPDEDPVCEAIVDIFRASRNHYGTRKIKVKLHAQGLTVSRRRIGRMMKENGLVSNYTTIQYHPKKETCNEADIEHIVNRTFSDQPHRNMVVSDLTYVRVGMSWNYICVLVDLFNREIIGYNAGVNKNAVAEATFKIIKTEFVHNLVFGSLDILRCQSDDYVNWFNNHRIHSSLGYLTPAEYRMNTLKKLSNHPKFRSRLPVYQQ